MKFKMWAMTNAAFLLLSANSLKAQVSEQSPKEDPFQSENTLNVSCRSEWVWKEFKNVKYDVIQNIEDGFIKTDFQNNEIFLTKNLRDTVEYEDGIKISHSVTYRRSICSDMHSENDPLQDALQNYAQLVLENTHNVCRSLKPEIGTHNGKKVRSAYFHRRYPVLPDTREAVDRITEIIHDHNTPVPLTVAQPR